MGRVRDPVEEVTWKLSFQSKEPSEMQKNQVGQHGHPRAAGEDSFSATLAFGLSPVES